MMTLLRYEFKKIFNNYKWVVLTTLALAAFFLVNAVLIATRADWTRSAVFQVVTTVSFLGLGILMTIYFFAPMVASIISYYKDLNDPHAVFETYIPQSGWKRILAKYIGYFLTMLGGILMSALIAWVTFEVVRRAAPAQVRFEIDNSVLEMLRQMDKSSVTAILEGLRFLVGTALGFTAGSLFFTFFITLQAVLRHRVRGATPLTFLAAALTGMGLSWIGETFLANGGVLDIRLLGISADAWFSLVVSIIAFLIMGWMLEHRTELR